MLASGAPLRFVGLDVTEQVRLTREDADEMAAAEHVGFAPFAGECAARAGSSTRAASHATSEEHDSCALHDPLAVAVVSPPELVTWQPAHVAGRDHQPGHPGRHGRRPADLENPPTPNCQIGTAVDSAGILGLFLDRIATLP